MAARASGTGEAAVVAAPLPEREGEPSDRMDVAGAVGQFLRDVDLSDIVVELVQNELDAGATHTCIDFGSEALVCEGDGRPLDAKAWARLESVMGAGGDVAAKVDGIGSKNHGLRTLFLIADRIGIQSDGQRADLTVRGDPLRPAVFKPGFWPRMADAAAPTGGTRITAPYRTTAVKVPDGDNTTRRPATIAELDAVFEQAVSGAADRFVSGSAPGTPWRYVLTLSRSGRPTQDFTFESVALTGTRRGLWQRTCRLRIGGGRPRTIERRHAVRYAIRVDDGGKVPRLFKAGSRVFAELNWPVDRAGRPRAGLGRLRYPIVFPSAAARSGHGYDVSAPFVAGRARHGVSIDGRNLALVEGARDAFIAASPLLTRAYGAAAGGLVRSAAPLLTDVPAERVVVAGMLDVGGLRVVGNDARGRLVETGAPAGGPVTVVQTVAANPAVERDLIAMAVASGAVLSPVSPVVIHEHLVALSADDGRVRLFDDEAAVRLAFVTTIRDGEALSDDGLRVALVGARALDALSRGSGVPPALVAELKASGALPGFAGKGVDWGDARQAERDPPEIPGVSSPPVVHQALAGFGVLSRGGLKLTPFKLDERLARLDFTSVIADGRQRFFDWLSANAHTLRASTLRAVSQMPVWPGVDGMHRPLSAYYLPRPQFLRDLLASASTRPTPAVIALARSKKLPARSLTLGEKPPVEQILEWHRAALEALPQFGAVVAELDRIEATLERLAAYEPGWMAALGAQHRTLSQAGDMAPVSALHVPSAVTFACGLPPALLSRSRRSGLYLVLGARPKPGVGTLLDVLRTDHDPVRLYARLEAYRGAGGDLPGLSAEPIVPVEGTARAGGTLAFAGEPDFWGAWKVRIEADDVAEHRALLGQIGVIRSRPTREHSLGFLRWLGQQRPGVQREHHQQVDRHWRERAIGPLSWGEGDADVPCVPVTGATQPFGLVGLTDAREPKQAIFLDDFPEIAREVLDAGRARLTLVQAPGVRTSILDVLAAARIPSLRAAAGLPRRMDGSGDIQTVADLSLTLTQLQSRAGRANLRVKLPLHGGDTADLRGDWQKLLKDLKGVRTRPALLAEYQVLGGTYLVPVGAGIDRQTGLLWIAGDADRLPEFYGVLATYLFWAGREDTWALLRAARDGRQLNMFESDGQPADDDGAEDDDDASDDDGGGGEDEDDGIGKGHGLGGGMITPVVPNPKPLAAIGKHTPLPRRAVKTPRPSSRSGDRRSVEEEEQKRQLKADHYGFHCQACLGEMEVLKAAPPGTYVYAPGFRARLLHAHHAQQRQNQGALGAGNLLILCEYHHKLWGDRLARGPVLAALTIAKPIRRRFPVDDAGKSLLIRQGLLAIVAIDVEPFEAKLYFTAEHAKAWTTEGGAAGEPEVG